MIGDEELNPCSACGHPAHIRGWISREPYGDTFQISCNNRAKCINETEWFNTKEKAIEAWNAANEANELIDIAEKIYDWAYLNMERCDEPEFSFFDELCTDASKYLTRKRILKVRDYVYDDTNEQLYNEDIDY